MFIYYKNSILASLFSIFGSILGIYGVICIFGLMGEEKNVVLGFLLFIPCAALLLLAKKVSRDKSFKKWWKQEIESRGLCQYIASSTDTAVQIYNKNPQDRTLKKIAELNPKAAKYIVSTQK